jgi:hypothetical protein
VNRESTVGASLEEISDEMARTAASTSTMNLIVWIDDPDRRDWILERAGLLAEKHPSLTVVLDHTGLRTGDATVSTTTTGVIARPTAFGKRVDIDVAGADAPTIESYVNELCPTDVPTVLWWSGANAASREIFEALLSHVSLIVVDSSGAARDDSRVRRLVTFHAQHHEIPVRDLAWLRLSPWQDIIATFFDDPRLVEELFSLRRLHIASGSSSEALYLGSWLASRLGWTASGPDDFVDRNGKHIAFERERQGQIRRVQSVCLDTDTSRYCGAVTDDPTVVNVWSEGEKVRPPRLFPLRAIDNASLLERAILDDGTDDVFEQALHMLETLLEPTA